jgi:hypothetical protein
MGCLVLICIKAGFMFLVYEITRHIAIAMQQAIVDISQKMYLLIQHMFAIS